MRSLACTVLDMFACQAARTSLRRPLGLSLAVAVLAVVVLALPNFSLAAFSGQNGKIFYEQNGDIWSVNPDGTGAVDLTPGYYVSEQRPFPSADGHHVVFQTFRNRGWNIFSMNADGSNPVAVTNTREPVINFEPAFSPDGSKIVFMRRSTTGAQDILVVNPNGTGTVNLTNSPAVNESAPEFSPDGTKVVYLSTEPKSSQTAEYSNDIWVMNADGSSPKQLTETDPAVRNIGPTWSPDSTKIAYSTVECPSPSAYGCGTPAPNGLRVMNADGSDETLLLNGGNPIHSAQLSWSPDGTRIAFEAATGGILSTVGATGGAPTLLVVNSDAHYPSWVPASEEGTPPVTGEGTPPASPSPSSAGTPPVVSPAPVLPARMPLKCGKGKKKKVVKGRAKCVKKRKYRK
jgi:Tol biopolymer transport system component